MQLRLTRSFSSVATLAAFLLPLLAGMVLFQALPLAIAAYNSTLSINIADPDAAKPVGLRNYADLLHNARFFHALGNSLLYMLGKLAVQLPLGLALALLANQAIRGRSILRLALFAPLVASEVVVAMLWNVIYFPDSGLLNAILSRLGLPTQGFITSASQALPSILSVVVWQDVGFTVLIFLAGLQGIPEELYEAAHLDGVNTWQKMWYLTLPLLKRSIMLAAFMATLGGFRIFTPIYVMTQGGPQESTTSAIYYIYEQAFKFLNMGPASAMAVIFIALLALVTLVESRLLRTEVQY
jgi:ABC-type sugar transport system permease subunit